MKKISADSTWSTKRNTPAIFAGFFILAIVVAIWQGIKSNESPVPVLVAIMIMAVITYRMFKKFTFDLVDEVWDDGEALLVRNKNVEERIELANIVNVTDLTTAGWPRVTLLLKNPCKLGASVSFCPKGGTALFSGGSPVALDLIQKLEAARQRPGQRQTMN